MALSSSYEFCGEDMGCHVARMFLLPAYRESSADELQFHIGRLVDQFRIGFAILAIRAASERTKAGTANFSWAAAVEGQLRNDVARGGRRFAERRLPYTDNVCRVTASIINHLTSLTAPEE